MNVSPCSHCNSTRISVVKKKGTVGRVTRTPWYREIITCKQCNISVQAGTPDNAIILWNKAYENRT